MSGKGLKEETVKKWILENNWTWLEYDLTPVSEPDPNTASISERRLGSATCHTIVRLRCKVCLDEQARVRALRNFSESFIKGVTGSALKKDNVKKHSQTEMHIKAIGLSRGQKRTLSDIYSSTPLGRAFKKSNSDEESRVSKLVEITYMLAKEEIPFSKFPSYCKMEKRHGVALGTMYITEPKCSEFTSCIGQAFENELVTALTKSPYFSILTDGSTDASVTEKELIYILYLTETGEAACRFFKLSDVHDATAQGLRQTILDSYEEIMGEGEGQNEFQKKLIGLCCDGASVNMGKNRGLATLLKADSPWLVTMHCMNHRLELALKDAFSQSYVEEIINILTGIYFTYEKSPKRLRDLKTLAEILGESFVKPVRACGTRWAQHKIRACDALLKSYSVIVSHLENLVSESNTIDTAKFRGYLKKMKSCNFVLNLLYFRELLEPVTRLSCNLQGDVCDLLFAKSGMEALLVTLDDFTKAGAAGVSKETEFSKFLNEAESSFQTDPNSVCFKGVPLSNVEVGLRTIEEKVKEYAESLKQCIQHRFHDLQTNDIFKGLKLLDPSTWPKDREALIEFGKEELSLVQSHFHALFKLHNVKTEAFESEFTEMKLFWLSNLSHLHRADFWSAVYDIMRTQYPNLLHVYIILKLLPVSNAKVERAFSFMRRVKTDWRNGLSENTLNHLLRIDIDGPDIDDFDPSAAVHIFYSDKVRRSGTQNK